MITLEQLIKYTAKAVMLADPEPNVYYPRCPGCKNTNMILTDGELFISFNDRGTFSGKAKVLIKDTDQYQTYLNNLLKQLNKFTGGNYTINDLKTLNRKEQA